MKISYKKIYPKKRARDEVVDHYYGETMGDYLTEEDCRGIELERIYRVLTKGVEHFDEQSLMFLPTAEI